MFIFTSSNQGEKNFIAEDIVDFYNSWLFRNELETHSKNSRRNSNMFDFFTIFVNAATMPSDRKKTKQTKNSFEFIEEKEVGIPADEAAPSSKSRKRPLISNPTYSDDESDCEDIKAQEPSCAETEMTSLLNSFGADISKTLSAKRKRLTTFTSSSLKTSNRKYEELFSTQQTERDKMNEEFCKQIGGVFSQWESDVHKSKDSEEKLETIMKQLQKTLQQQRVVQSQRLKSIKTLHDQYMKGISELVKVHKDQQTNIHGELRKELSTLQKKMMDDARQEEISNVRKSLQSMLSQV
ncbi:synaptonemal complex protein 3-like [Hydractinia symbiolongicarpus]|uniref:synaptonemal complex protein 3-like n=1 Tax=Hydractinia symbiolongicarpus TaxID=13093 RepID=UPI00254BCB18|nr:synaptonemal complex protein 3-like [Hydractinia symbiolongicarpus]